MRRNGLLFLSVLVLPVLFLMAASAQAQTFTADLSGKSVVPPVDTPATGKATLRLSKSGDSLTFTLSVKDISDVTMAHIHMGEEGASGPPVVWLFPSTHKPTVKAGQFSGVLAKGTITAKDLAGPLQGKAISDLVDAIKSGKAYVNVHTKAHGGGEIRGQLK